MEGKALSAHAYNKGCIGCQRFGSDVMVSFLITNEETKGNDFVDMFLTTEQAQYLVKRINDALEQNKKQD